MELILKNGAMTEEFDLKKGAVTSIQSGNVKNILINLRKDYDVVYINNSDPYFVGSSILGEIDYYTNRQADYELVDSILRVLDFNNDFLNRSIFELSHTEKIFLNVIRNVVLNKEIVVFDDIFSMLDFYSQKRIKSLLNYLKDNDYVIIITSRDCNVLYSLAQYSIIWNKNFFRYDTCDSIYTDVKTLVDNKFTVPTLPLITYKAKTDKNVKLFYNKDVRDIIKDIYKHV